MMTDEGRLRTVREICTIDARLAGEMPDAFRSGVHVAVVEAISHYKRPWNEYAVFREIRENPAMPLSVDTILRLYQILTEGTDAEHKGLKVNNNYVTMGDDFYIPATPEETPAAMEALCRAYRHLGEPLAAVQDETVAARLADIFRFQLEMCCIHPMADGNGRLTHLLIQMLMMRAGLQCALYVPLDLIEKSLHGKQMFWQVIKGAGMYYGMKPLEYDLFIDFMLGVVMEAYRCMETAVDAYNRVIER